MPTPLPAAIAVDFPLFAFSHCRDVIAAVSKAGGFGVFGAAGYSPEELEIELAWIDAHIDGKPYGVDLLIPENLTVRTRRGMTRGDLAASIPGTHRAFVHDLLARHGVDADRKIENYTRDDPDRPPPYQFETGEQLPARQKAGAVARRRGSTWDAPMPSPRGSATKPASVAPKAQRSLNWHGATMSG